MTSSTNRASLIERLEAEDPFRISNDGMTVAELPPPGKLRNPDGPEAAALIRELVEALAPFADAYEQAALACEGDCLSLAEARWMHEAPSINQFRKAATLRAKASHDGGRQ